MGTDQGAGSVRPAGMMMINREAVLARAKADRRRYRRVPVNLNGRIFLPDGEREANCKILDLSPGGARISCQLNLASGTIVVLYVDEFGRFEGNIVRLTSGDFGVQFNCPALKRERIAEQLTVFLNKGVPGKSVLRRHERKATRGVARFTRASGEIVACEVLDLSLSGVSLITDAQPPIGEIVLIGQMAGRIARHHDRGIAIEFITPMPTATQGPSQQPMLAAVS